MVQLVEVEELTQHAPPLAPLRHAAALVRRRRARFRPSAREDCAVDFGDVQEQRRHHELQTACPNRIEQGPDGCPADTYSPSPCVNPSSCSNTAKTLNRLRYTPVVAMT